MIKRQSLSSQTETSGTLGFAGSYWVINGASGTLTWLPAVGQIIAAGRRALPRQRRAGHPADRQCPVLPGAIGRDDRGRRRAAKRRPRRARLRDDQPSSARPRILQRCDDRRGSRRYRRSWRDARPARSRSAKQCFSRSGGCGHRRRPPRWAAAPAGQPVARPAARRAGSSRSNSTRPSRADVAVGDHVTITLPDNSTTPGVVSRSGPSRAAGQSGGSPTVPVRSVRSIRRDRVDRPGAGRCRDHDRERQQRAGRAGRRAARARGRRLRGRGGLAGGVHHLVGGLARPVRRRRRAGPGERLGSRGRPAGRGAHRCERRRRRRPTRRRAPCGGRAGARARRGDEDLSRPSRR